MTEIERIQDQIRRVYEGDAWHGTSTHEILAGVPAAVAVKRVLPAVHTIWELALHMTAWRAVVVRRIEGEMVELSHEADWPRRQGETEEDWRQILDELDRSQERLLDAVGSMTDARLGDAVPGKDYDYYVMLQGIVQHDAYHAGQVALMRKLLAE